MTDLLNIIIGLAGLGLIVGGAATQYAHSPASKKWAWFTIGCLVVGGLAWLMLLGVSPVESMENAQTAIAETYKVPANNVKINNPVCTSDPEAYTCTQWEANFTVRNHDGSVIAQGVVRYELHAVVVKSTNYP